MNGQSYFQSQEPNDLLFCLDMANNHQGSVPHGINIIKEIAAVAQRTGARVMVKLQFRALETLLHPADRSPIAGDGHFVGPYTKRFRETALTQGQFGDLISCAREHRLPIYATPFDELSVDLCMEFGFDIIKVGSCSAYDWPLLRKIASTGLPVIISLGGLALNEIDEVVDFFQSSGNPLALMHCISSYPAAPEDLQLDFIQQFKRRYSHLPVGYSGHESPQDVEVGGWAVAKGATILERHIGLPNGDIKLNAYSLSPEQAEKWILATQQAALACANGCPRRLAPGEKEALLALKRGIYARRTIPAGKTITADDVYLAMPCFEGQFHAGKYYEVVDFFTPMRPIYPNMPIGLGLPDKPPPPIALSSIAARVKEMLDEAKISLDGGVVVELSHQYGFDRFFEFGAVIIDVVNRHYCKKLIVQFPNQTHPSHRHIKKEETFQVLSGAVKLVLEAKEYHLEAGQKQLIERGMFHSFCTESGVILEEISTTHIRGDSEYEDGSISSDPAYRKTKILLPP
jgi:N-acetylneuraminate synthase